MTFPRRLLAPGVSCLLWLCTCVATQCSEAQQASFPSAQPLAESAAAATDPTSPGETVIIPGPLRSFLRMAGVSQKIAPEDVLPLLARNVYLRGYQVGTETEFLILLDRYVHQARELQHLAGPTEVIRVANCTDAAPLVQILGYYLRQGCGQKNATFVTLNPERAFLTIDSGFPLTDLEEALQKGTVFTYSFPSTRVPVLFRESEWTTLNVGRNKGSRNLVDILLHDPAVARLYWALSKNDVESRMALQRSIGLKRLLPYAPVLDFYGSQICIRSGRLIVPGDSTAERGWKELVGANPESPGDFVLHMLSRDGGWMAAYFDVLSRVSPEQQKHLTEATRLKRLYEAFRASDSDSHATKGVFRSAPDLLVLFTRLDWEPNGDPHVPGNLDVWKETFNQKTGFKIVHELGKHASNWTSPDQLLEAMVSLSHTLTDDGPLQSYLMLSELDSRRPADKRLSVGTVRLLISKFPQFNSWYVTFCEFPDLDELSIARFVNVAETVDSISNEALRGNALGTFQANIGLWQILARQGQIPTREFNSSWQKMIEPFASVSSAPHLFDAAHTSLGAVLKAATGRANPSQDEIIELLAGPPQDSADGQGVHRVLAERMRSVLDDQHLVSLDTLFALGDGLNDMARGAAVSEKLLPLAGNLREFELPRPIFTNSEKIEWAPLVYKSRHTELQVRADLSKVIKAPGTPAQLTAARGQLAPFLRDTLVGLNYAYYEPPDAQILHNNPLFVRSHDFTGLTYVGGDVQHWGVPNLFGVGTPAGGGAYLIGSLADLPYALAATEQDFIVPENVQALIWKELVPDLLLDATLPRWWGVSSNELHAVTLYQRFGEELLTASLSNTQLRAKVSKILSDRLSPQRLERAEQSISHREDASAASPGMMPAETFYLAAEFRRRFPEEAASLGPAGQALQDHCRQYPADTSWERLSKDFGIPHPTLARSYTLELLNVKPFPAFGGYSSRLFGESWESSNLYWARLVDEMGYSPVMLNRLVPELTRHMIAKIFATDLEDWGSLLRAMQETGTDFQQGKIATLPVANRNLQN